MIQAAYLRTSDIRRLLRRDMHGPAALPEPPWAPVAGSGYGARGRGRWIGLGAVVLAHAGLLGALIAFDVIEVAKPKPSLQIVDITPDLPPPPKEPPPPPATARDAPPQESPPIAPPERVVEIAAPPPPVQVFPPAPPPLTPSPPAVAAPAVAAEGPSTAVALPSTLSKAPLSYPIEARMRRQQGIVRLRVTIDTEGAVADVAVATSSGVDSLDKAALASVRKWRFKPRIEAGQPVGATGFLSIPFRLT